MATNPAPGDGNQAMSRGLMIILLISSGITFYLMTAYIGPYKWAAELQLAYLHSYSQKLTFVAAYLFVFGAMLLLALPLRRVRQVWDAGQAGGDIDGSWILVLIGIGFAAVGCYNLYTGKNAGTFQSFSVAKLESGEQPPSRFVRITGFPYRDAAVSFGEKSRSMDVYVPVASSEIEFPAGGVRLFLKIKDQKPWSSGSFSGYLEKNDLPGAVRTEMEKAAILKGNDYFVLELGETPESKQLSAKIMAGVGAAMVGVGLLIALVRRLWRKTPGG